MIMVNGFYVLEKRNLMEHDSPVPGSFLDVVTEEILFGYLPSEQVACSLISELQKKHQAGNPTLKSRDNFYGAFGLVGEQEHPFSHELQITHKIRNVDIHSIKINNDLSALEGLVVRRKQRGVLPFHLLSVNDLNYGYIGRVGTWSDLYERKIGLGLAPTHPTDLMTISALLSISRSPATVGQGLTTVFVSPEDALQWMKTPLEVLDSKSPADLLHAGNYHSVETMLEILHEGSGGV